MSTTVDNRVVQMTFNNKQFEKGVDQTLKTIDKLNKALKFEDASDGLENIQSSANSLNFKQLSDNVQSISDRFSGLGIIGAQIWSRIGNAAIDLVTGPFKKVEQAFSNITSKVENQIVQGGWNRALNLEKAEFMLKNLGYGWSTERDANDPTKYVSKALDKNGKEVTNAYKSIAEAVDGTAFSLDEAASAAANFLASGVDAGEELYNVLRSVQGMSSIFSTDFNQVAGYYQKIASAGAVTQGVVTYMTQTMGAPIAELLKESLHLTDEQLSDALKDGLISFETFSDVMLQKFGDSLDKANESYEGVVSNVKSALSRIGSAVTEPLIKRMIPTLDLLRLSINKVKTTLVDSGFYEFVNGKIDKLFTIFDNLLTPITIADKEFTGLKNIITGLVNIATGLGHVFNAFTIAFNVVFGKYGQKNVKSFSERFLELSKRFEKFTSANPDGGAFVKILHVFKTLARVIKGILPLVKAVFKVFTLLFGIVGKLIYPFSILVSAIEDLLEWFTKLIKGSKTYAAIVELLHKAGEKLNASLSNLGDKTQKFVNGVKDLAKNNPVISGAINVLKDAFANLDEKVANFITSISNGELFNDIKDIIGPAFDAISSAVSTAVDALGDFIGIDFSSISIDDITKAFKDFFDTIGEKFTKFKEDAVWAVHNPSLALQELSDKAEEIAGNIGTNLEKIFNSVSDSFTNFTDKVLGFKKGLDDSSSSIDEFNKKSSEIDTDNTNFDNLSKLGEIMTKLGDALTKVKDALKDFGTTVWQSLLDAFHLVQDELDVHSFKDFLELLKEGFKIFMAYNIGEAAAGLGTFFASFETIFRGQKVSLFKLVPDMILKIAAAFAILAYSIRMLARIDTGVFDNVVRGMELIIGSLLALAVIFKKLGMLTVGKAGTVELEGKGKNGNSFAAKVPKYLANQLGTASELAALGVLLTGLALTIASVAGSIVLLTKTIDGLEDPGVLEGAIGALVVVLAVLFAGMAAILKVLKTSNTSDFSKEIGLGGREGTLRVTNSVESFSKNAKGNQGMTGAIFALAGFLVGLSVALVAITAVISAFVGLAKLGGLWEGIGALAAVLTLMTGMMAVVLALSKKTEKEGNVTGTSGSGIAAMAALMVTIGNALLKAAAVVILLGHMDPGDWGQGMLGLVGAAAALAIMILAVTFLLNKSKTDALDGAAIILACAGAMLMIAGAIKMVAGMVGENMSVDDLWQITGMIVTCALLCLLLALIPRIAGENSLQGAAIILACSTAILEIAGALKLLSGVDLGDLFPALLAILAVCAMILGVGFVIGSVPTISAGLQALGKAFLYFGGGIFLAAAGLALIIAIMDKIDGDYENFCDKTEQTVDFLIRLVVSFITGVILGITDSVVDIADAILKALIAIVDWLSDHAAEIGVVVGRFFAVLVEIFIFAVAEFVRDVIDAFIRLFKSGFEINSPSKVMYELVDFVFQAAINAIKDGLAFILKILKAGVKGVFKFIKKIPSKILHLLLPDDVADKVEEIGKSIIQFAINGLKSMMGSLGEAVSGVIDVITAPFNAAAEAVESVFEKITGKEKEFQEQQQRWADEAERAEQDRIATAKAFNESNGATAYEKLKKELDTAKELKKQYEQIKDNPLWSDSQKKKTLEEYNSSIKRLKTYEGQFARAFGEQYSEFQKTHDQNEWINFKVFLDGQEKSAYRGWQYVADMIAKGLGDGLEGAEPITDWMTADYKEMLKFWDINSPSKLAGWVGKMIVYGLGNGITDNESYGLNALATFSEAACNVMESDLQPTITPVLDFASVQNGTSQIGRIYSEGVKAAANLDIKSDAGRTAETLDNMADLFNQIVFNTDSTGVEGKLDITADLLTQLLTALSTQQLVLDTGAVVGGIAPAMDKELGMRSIRVGRRV